MKVRDIMMGSPKSCHPEANVASAVEMMWVNDCGFLPVVESDGRVSGVVTDRDICIALGTRNRRASEVLVREVMTPRAYVCTTEDDVHTALEAMEEHQIRRLPVVSSEGKLVGVLSMGDVTLHAGRSKGRKKIELSSDEVVETFKGVRARSKRIPSEKEAGAQRA